MSNKYYNFLERNGTKYFKLEYTFEQYPCECCPFIKTFSYICEVVQFWLHNITYCESVFRKSFVENVEVFLIIRAERNNTHFRIDTCGRSRSAYPYPISIRVWGIVSSIYDQGLSTTFNKINESQLHTFFVYTTLSFRGWMKLFVNSIKFQ